MNFSNLAHKIAEEVIKNITSNTTYDSIGLIIEQAALEVLNSLELPKRPVGDTDYWRGENDMYEAWTKALEYEEDKLLTERKRLMKRWKEKNDISEESFDDKPQTKGQDRKWCEHCATENDKSGQKNICIGNHIYQLQPDWNYCPICGKQRPTKETIAYDKLANKIWDETPRPKEKSDNIANSNKKTIKNPSCNFEMPEITACSNGHEFVVYPSKTPCPICSAPRPTEQSEKPKEQPKIPERLQQRAWASSTWEAEVQTFLNGIYDYLKAKQ